MTSQQKSNDKSDETSNQLEVGKSDEISSKIDQLALKLVEKSYVRLICQINRSCEHHLSSIFSVGLVRGTC